MCSFIPAAFDLILSSVKAFAVIAMIGIVLASFLFNLRILSVASYPSISGIMTSIRIASKQPSADFSKISRASRPFHAFVTTAPAFCVINSTISIFSSLSSTRRIFSPAMEPTDFFSFFSASLFSISILNGIVITKVVPLSFSLSKVISPPILFTNPIVIDIPSPVLPYLL